MGRYAILEELKGQTRIEDAVDDNELDISLDAAEGLIDRFCRRGANGAPREFTVPDTGSQDDNTTRLYVPHASDRLRIDDLVQLDTLEKQTTANGDWTAISSDDFELRPLNPDDEPYTSIFFTTPHTAHRFRVSGWFGWPQTPAVVKQAALLQAARFAQRRNAQFGIATLSNLEGTGMRLLNKLDADVELLLNDVRRHHVLVA